MASDSQKIVLKDVRFDWVKVFEPEAYEPGAEEKYSICVLLPNDHPQLAELKAASEKVAQTRFPKVKAKDLKLPVRDGDTDREEYEAYKGHQFLNASATKKFPPTVIDGAKNKADPEAWGSGDYGWISIELYAFENKGNRGCAAGINAVQFRKKGEPLGKRDHTGDFDVAPAEDITEENY